MFRLAGTPRAGGVCAEVKGKSAVRKLLGGLTDAWKWTSQCLESVTIEGSRAAVRFVLTATHAPTKATIVTEIMDDIVLDENQKIVSFVEFVDTAEAARLGA